MALPDLLGAVSSVLRHQASVTIDDDMYHDHVDGFFCQDSAQRLAEALICGIVSRYATVEKFQRADTKQTYLFVIAANSMAGWRAAIHGIQAVVTAKIDVPSRITTRILIEHVIETC